MVGLKSFLEILSSVIKDLCWIINLITITIFEKGNTILSSTIYNT